MKKCPYYGKEYSDDATACFIDGEPLADNTPQLAVVEDQAVDAAPRKDDPHLTFSDYQSHRSKHDLNCGLDRYYALAILFSLMDSSCRFECANSCPMLFAGKIGQPLGLYFVPFCVQRITLVCLCVKIKS